MNLLPIKSTQQAIHRASSIIKSQYQVVRGRIMSGHDPQLDIFRIVDRLMSTAAILSTEAYAAAIPLLRGEPVQAHIFELSRIARTFGITRRSGRHYTLQIQFDGKVYIRQSLDYGEARRVIEIDGNSPYIDPLIRIAAFSDKDQAIAWARTQYPLEPTDRCGIGNACHLQCHW